jgi:SRSO17 transposase
MMLTNIRQNDYLYPVPKFDLSTQEIEAFSHELNGFHSEFHDYFKRSESREHFFNYMNGQFSELERKSIEPIALNVKGGNVRAMQRFVSDAPWDDDKIMVKYRNLVASDLQSPDGALIFDESGFAKKGNESIGVAKQYCGNLGKVDNCQVGVFAAYASETGYSLVDKRLFIPEKWFGDEFESRRNKCNLPAETVFKTKPQLAVEMLNSLADEGTLPFKYILGDSVYGISPEFIEAANKLVDTTYFVSVPEKTLCWLKSPVTVEKKYKYKGEQRTKTVLVDTDKKPISLSALAKNTNSYFWYRRKVSEGTKGPIVYEFTRRRVKLSGKGLPQKEVWVIIRRTIGKKPEYSYYISNASSSARLPLFVWLSGMRWAIEQCFEETKSELGMDQYEVRKFPGWQHHIITCMLGHFFLWHLKIRLGKKSSIYYSISAEVLVSSPSTGKEQ